MSDLEINLIRTKWLCLGVFLSAVIGILEAAL